MSWSAVELCLLLAFLLMSLSTSTGETMTTKAKMTETETETDTDTDTKWSYVKLVPFYDESFNASLPFFHLDVFRRTATKGSITGSGNSERVALNPAVVCVMDTLDIRWTVAAGRRRGDVPPPAAALILAPPHSYSSVLATPIGELYETLTMSITTRAAAVVAGNDGNRDNDDNINNNHNNNVDAVDMLGNYGDGVATAESGTRLEAVDQSTAIAALQDDGTIFCSKLSADVFCRPVTRSIQLLQDVSVLIVTFDRDTNTPALETLDAVCRALMIVPAPLLPPLWAEWRSARELHLSLNETDIARIVTAHQAGEPVRVLLQSSSPLQYVGLSGKKTVRMMELGQLHLFIADLSTGEVLSTVHVLQATPCAQETTLPSLLWAALPHQQPQQKEEDEEAIREQQRRVRNPLFSMAGIHAVSGTRPITLLDATFSDLVGIACLFNGDCLE
jgi:hypothetical protein